MHLLDTISAKTNPAWAASHARFELSLSGTVRWVGYLRVAHAWQISDCPVSPMLAPTRSGAGASSWRPSLHQRKCSRLGQPVWVVTSWSGAACRALHGLGQSRNPSALASNVETTIRPCHLSSVRHDHQAPAPVCVPLLADCR